METQKSDLDLFLEMLARLNINYTLLASFSEEEVWDNVVAYSPNSQTSTASYEEKQKDFDFKTHMEENDYYHVYWFDQKGKFYDFGSYTPIVFDISFLGDIRIEKPLYNLSELESLGE